MAPIIPTAGPGRQDCAATEATARIHPAGARETLQSMRNFRKKVLAKSKNGRLIIKEYNTFTPRVLLLFILEPSLLKEAAQFIEVVTPIANAMVAEPTRPAATQKVTAK